MNKKDSPFSYKSPNDATGFLLYKTYNLWQREIKRSLKEFDLTHTQFVILASTYWLVLNQDSVTQVEVANHAEMDIMMTSNVLRTLEKKDIVTRKEHAIDTRAKVVSITDKGITTLTKAIKVVEGFDREFFKKLKDNENFNSELLELLKPF